MLKIAIINISAGVGLGQVFSRYAFLALALSATPAIADNFRDAAGAGAADRRHPRRCDGGGTPPPNWTAAA